MSNSARFSWRMFRSGCVISRYSNSRMVGLKSLYCSSRVMTSGSTFSSHDKCFQFGINLISLSKQNPNCSIKPGFILRTSANGDPSKTKQTLDWCGFMYNNNDTRTLSQFSEFSISEKWLWLIAERFSKTVTQGKSFERTHNGHTTLQGYLGTFRLGIACLKATGICPINTAGIIPGT